jgi:acetylornithine deacetylase/succinyl-diaminopimelate desuccinylase-like protein
MDEVGLLKELVGIDTTATTSSNYPEMASLLKEKILQIGGKVDVVYGKAKDGRPRPNVIGRIRNGGETVIGLNAHYDAVPVDRKEWKTDPFTLTITGNNAYGRGASDDKSGIAIALAAADEIRNGSDIELIFTCDEEIGSEYGLRWVAEKERRSLHSRYAVVLDDEPRPVVGASGVAAGEITVRGKEVHAGMPFLGRNAIEISLQLLKEMSEFKTLAARHVSSYYGDRKRKVYGRFSITMLNSGIVSNLIPGSLRAQFDLRSIPEMPLNEAKAELEGYFKRIKGRQEIGARLKFTETHDGYTTDRSSEIVKRLLGITGSKKLYASFGGLDGTFLSNAGIPCIAYGALNKSNHKSNEYVSLGTMRKVKRTVNAFIGSFGTG